ncbi:MAG: carbonic anhydrase [Methanomassiliicoccales archaeon PtaB.Bin215]|nr:MAG: carbonic anhydrase [Methanomassiliicoccales archaeon PtaB.Bin215]
MYTTPPKDEDGADLFILNVLRGNRAWMERYVRPPVNGSAKAVVLTCMDSRIPPLEMLGLSPGEVFIIRNAGNSVTDDTLRSLLICLTVMECRNVLVVGHSSCGMRSCGGLDERVAKAVDVEALSDVLGEKVNDARSWLGFYEPHERYWVLDQAASLRELLKKVMPGVPVKVCSALYHLEDGRLEMLDQPSQKSAIMT